MNNQNYIMCMFPRDAGALGARLTGAGWGGCTVALLHAGSEAAFLTRLRATFYAQQDDAHIAQWLFTSLPSGGAAVYVPAQ